MKSFGGTIAEAVARYTVTEPKGEFTYCCAGSIRDANIISDILKIELQQIMAHRFHDSQVSVVNSQS
jgi:predicted Abi (CAAX) family protease